jgi:hypothetical protein
MRKRQRVMVVVLISLAAAVAAGIAVETPVHPSHHAVQAAALVWGPAPPVLGAGVQMAVVHGDPFAEGPYVVRARFPAGAKIMPHWHPTAENVSVLSGSFGIGAGDTFDRAKGEILAVGGFVSLPALMHHYAWAETAVEVQIHGMGPFALFYVNPADDPTPKSKG